MTCPICESPDVACVHDTGPLCFYRCSDCELIYRDPMPSQAELDHFYQHEYRQEAPDSPRMANYFRAQALHRMAILTSRGTRTEEDEWIPALPQKGGALDIGAAAGAFGYELEGAFEDHLGLEVSQSYADKSGYDVVQCDIEDVDDVEWFEAEYYKAKWDLITMFHVLEHLRDPVSVLAKIRGWLAPEGRLWIEVPDMDHPIGGDIQNEYIYPHLWGFNGTNLLIVLSAAGWVVADLFRKESDYTGRTSLHVIARVP